MKSGIAISALLITPAALILFKVGALGYSPEAVVPDTVYDVNVSLSALPRRQSLFLRTWLPLSDERQTVLDERNASSPLLLTVQEIGTNRQAEWRGADLAEPIRVNYAYTIQARAWRWEIDPTLSMPSTTPAGLEQFLQSTPAIQTNSDEVVELHRRLTADETNLLSGLNRIFDYTANQVTTTDFTGSTDALTALRLREASCNGKSRLLVALLRRSNIPARLVGGLILTSGSKKTSHQWVEAYIAGHWVSFCPTNGHFASLPATYLRIYEGDEVLFSHTPEVNFGWLFRIKKRLVPSAALHRVKDHRFNVLALYDLFAKAGISLTLLQIVLMIPLGALVATFFRNVVGLQTFGTFLPALIAAAARDTGIVWGLLGFTGVIVVIAVVRAGLEGFDLLHTPKLSAMLALVVALILGISLLGIRLGLIELAHLTLFPIAILTLTAERFSLVLEERGVGHAARTLAQTLIVTAICYAFMSSLFLQTAILTFPELVAVLVGLNLWLGRWMGLRVLEFWRFRSLIFAPNAQP